ncbi:AAA family ATPase [Subsaximicrobium wynnwilliamsii]|uniref:AAA family ATPase n=1 Tax=Subsaximicrobium wynnwilliamsii TaxID=291179 RepID=A0A5C6ZDG1_9FLAO|nr:ATP-binding protein [Subsaximicrobium wynnwilliamsii]TXD82114.1 AAA family ATPase [Subsaximicrobium wynnwilliamsii]TXD87759.1 AAA family ATPase [Subsaximicrobium wynnwilliamsii]TXE01570.1 AAA family ATPase [Subsaximicrobium wynnwilliamsii]
MKQDLYANRALDFNKLDHREFEEVVYHYFKDQIDKDLYYGIYDNVELSSSVGERGADAMLFLDGKITGIVQCKKYKSNLTIDLVLSEIIKFLLYHILETQLSNKNTSSLINDIKDFSYYFVVSKDFTQATKLLLASFNQKWSTKNIPSIISKVTSVKSFEKLNIEKAQEQLKELLNSINVVPITAVDLDPIVRINPYLKNRYFSPQSLVGKEQKDIFIKQNNTNEDDSISKEFAVKKTELISNDITRVKSFFGKNELLKIKRAETEEIFEWIQQKPKENELNIAVVAGNAGMGKSVILSQLYSKLKSENIPVISLKADRLIFNSIKDLESEYNLDVSFEKLFDRLIESDKTGVLLIDQIDALSQALSSDLKPLKFYDNLIQRFTSHPKVKIVISTRIYDLNYDPIISNYKGKKSFIIRALKRDVLIDVLKRSGIEKVGQFTEAFLELIAVPLHLDVFLKVYSESLKVKEIKSLQDLYSQLWKQKILEAKRFNITAVNPENLSDFIFKVALKMYDLQEINLDARLFEDQYFKEIKFLKSEGILVDAKNIEFFHQSFFDYAYARNFINGEKDLLTDILNRHQGLFVRSKIKQILNYKSSVLHHEYVSDVNKILQHKEVRFHIKLLILQEIAFQESPTIAEQNTVEHIVFADDELKSAFNTSLMDQGWLSFFINRDIFREDIENNNDELKTQITSSLRRVALAENNENLLKYYKTLKDSSIKDELIIDYLWQIGEVKSELAIELIENVFSRKKEYSKQYWFYSILENTSTNFPTWTAKNLREHIDIVKGTDINDDKNYFYTQHLGGRIYEKLWAKHPDVAYTLVKDVITEIISKRKFERNGIIELDSAFLLYDRKNLDLYKHNKQLDILQTYLEGKFITDPNFVRDEVNKYLDSNRIVYIIIGFSIIFKYPKEFKNEAYPFFSDTTKLEELYSLNRYLNYMMLEVFGQMYHVLNDEEKNKIEDILLSNFRKRVELRVIINDDGSKRKNKYYGIGKYELLNSINDKGKMPKHLKKDYLELFRKFGAIKNEEPEGTVVFVNRDPLGNPEYDKFSLEDWRNSFKTYTHTNKNYNSWNQPAEYEHGRKFVTVVSEEPNKFIDFVYNIIDDSEISNTYIVKALEGLKEGGIDVDKLKDVFLYAINQRKYEKENTLYLIWVTRYFTDKKKVYPEILDYLKLQIVSGDEGRENLNDALSTGINSIRGAAASSLVDYSFSNKTFNFVCETLQLLVDNSRPSTRASAIYKLQYLLKYGKEEILNLFLGLAKDYDAGVLKISINPLQYLVHYNFERLIPFFESALQVKESNKEIGKLITIGYCNNYVEADDLLESFLKHNEPNSIIKTAFEFIENGHKVEMALTLVMRFLDLESKEVGEIYNRAFFHLKPKQFKKLRTFLFEYVESSVGKWREYPFYDFLLECSGEHYDDCINLAREYKNHYEPNVTQRGLQNAPLKVIISSYNAVREYDKSNPILDKAMDIFDDMLKNEDYINASAHQILKDVDSY